MKRFLIIMMMSVCLAVDGLAQNIAVNTDVAWDAMMAPSVGAEIVMTKKSSLNINALFGWDLLGQDMKIGAFQPEWRVYLSGRPMYHHYVGFEGLLASYKLDIKSKTYDGDAVGAGLTYGYVLPIGRRWLVDFHTSLGYVWYRQKEFDTETGYVKGKNSTYSTGSLLMPMSIGVRFAYIIK